MTTPQLPDTREIEMKFTAAAPWVLNKADEIFLLSADEPKARRQYTSHLHYYDTPKLTLRKHGVLLRTLDANEPHFNSRIQIKTAGRANPNSLMIRTEFNLSASGNGLRLQDIKGHPANAFLNPAKRSALKHWFTTVTNRTELRAIYVIGGKNVMIECALDHVVFQRAADNMQFRSGCEIELEVKTKYSDPTLTDAEAQAAIRHVANIMLRALPHLKVTTKSRADLGFGDLAPAAAIPARGSKKPRQLNIMKNNRKLR